MTGVEEVPLRYAVDEIDERSGADLPLLSVSIHLGVRRRDELTDDDPRAETLESYKRCRGGDLVVNRMRAFQGALGVAPTDGLVSPDYAVLRPSRAVDGRFIAYLLRSPWGVAEMTSRLRGIGGVTAGVVRTPRVNVADLLDIRIPAWSVDRQTAVADLLDHECARIAALTRGLNDGSAALAEQQRETFDRLVAGVPTTPLRYFIEGIDQGWSPECEAQLARPGEWGVLKVGCVNYGTFRATEHKRFPEALVPRPDIEAQVGDLLMSRANTRELVGSAAVVEDLGGWRLMLSDKTYRLRLRDSAVVGFVNAALASRAGREQIEIATSGASSSMQNISQTTVRELRIPDLPVEEQLAIEREFAARSSQLIVVRAALSKLRRQLDDYRAALINEAVTGQLDVTAHSDAQMDERAHAAAEGAVAMQCPPARVG